MNYFLTFAGRIAFSLSFLLLHSEVFSDNKALENYWQDYFEAVKSGQNTKIDKAFLNQKTFSQSVFYIMGLLSHEHQNVRKEARNILQYRGLRSEYITPHELKPLARAAIMAIDTSQYSEVSDHIRLLQSIDRTMFSDDMRDLFHKKLSESPKFINEKTILFLGYLGGAASRIQLKKLYRSANTERTKWLCLLALCRMKEANYLSAFKNFIGRMEIDLDAMALFKRELIYTKADVVTEKLVQILNSDDLKCRTTNNDSNEQVLCAYRAMEILSQVVESFPFDPETDQRDYTKLLKLSRKWVLEQNTISVNENKF